MPQASRFGTNREWERKEAQKAGDLHRMALQVKVDNILELADKRRVGCVKALSLIPRPEAVNRMLEVLECVSPNL